MIESVSFITGPSVTIKSHHNVGGLPERMNMDLVEPLRELFKDGSGARRNWTCQRVSSVAILSRPGLPSGIPGDHPRQARHLRKADAISGRDRNAGYGAICKPLLLLPVQTVGVMGDARTYDIVGAAARMTSTTA